MKFIPEELTILEKSPLSSDYGETFVYAPANKDEQNLGNLYIIGLVQSNKNKKENAQFLSQLITIIKNEYYRNTVITTLASLKSALKKANKFLEDQKGALKKDFPKITLLAGSLNDGDIHLARLGNAVAFILRAENLQYIITPASPKLPSKNDSAFENIISGEIMEQDRLLLATPQVHKFSETEIIKYLTATSLAKEIENKEDSFKNLSFIALRPHIKKAQNIPINFKHELPPLISKKEKKDVVLSSANNLEPYSSPDLRSLAAPLRSFERRVGEIGDPGPLKDTDYNIKVPRLKRYKLALIIILVVVSAGATVYLALKFKKESAIKRKEAETLVEEINQLKEKTNSLLAINNESEAAELIASWREKLSRLNELDYFKTTRLTLASDLDKILKSEQKLEIIDRIDTVVDLENNSASFDPDGFALGKNKVIVYNKNTVYKFDLNRREGSLNVLGDDANIFAALEHPRNINEVLLLEQNKISAAETSNNSNNRQELWNYSANFKNFGYYNNALYLLGEDNSIYKLTAPFLSEESLPTTTPSAQPEDSNLTEWLKKDVKLPDAADMAIDGSIYILGRDNSVTEFSNGSQKIQFKLIEPVFKIFTSQNQKNIYLLSPQESLIVVVDKAGHTKKRLSHPELRDAKSFLVNSQERMIYFLKGKTVYSFEI